MSWDPIHRAWALREIERIAPRLPEAAAFGLDRLRRRSTSPDFGSVEDRHALAELRSTAAATIRSDRAMWTTTPTLLRAKRFVHRVVEGTAIERAVRRRRGLPQAAAVVRPRLAAGSPIVVHAIHALTTGGAQQLVVDLVTDPESALRHEVLASRVPFPRHYPGLRAFVFEHPSVPEVRMMLRRRRADLLHLAHYHHPTDERVAAWYDAIARAARLEGLPILQSNLTPGEPWLDPADLEGRHGAAHELVCCSRWSLEASGLPGMSGSVIHPGTPLGWFAERAGSARTDEARRLGLRVGFAARLDGDKFDRSIAEIFVAILERCPEVTVSIAGDGGLRKDLSARFASAGLSDRVEFLGRIPFEALPRFHASLDVALAPMAADTFGSGSVHAIACGTPVAGFAVAALPEILVHPESMARSGDAAALASVVERMLRDGLLRSTILDVQRRNAEARFDLSVMRKAYAARLKALATKPRR